MRFKFNPVLIEKVALVNKAAATYLKRGNVRPNMISTDDKNLGGAFTWHNSPQGYIYWYKISKEIP